MDGTTIILSLNTCDIFKEQHGHWKPKSQTVSLDYLFLWKDCFAQFPVNQGSIAIDILDFEKQFTLLSNIYKILLHVWCCNATLQQRWMQRGCNDASCWSYATGSCNCVGVYQLTAAIKCTSPPARKHGWQTKNWPSAGYHLQAGLSDPPSVDAQSIQNFCRNCCCNIWTRKSVNKCPNCS